MEKPEKHIESPENKKLEALINLKIDLNAIYTSHHSQESKIQDYEKYFGQGSFAKLERVHWAIREVEETRDSVKIDEVVEKAKRFWREIKPNINIQENIPLSQDRTIAQAFYWFFKEELGESFDYERQDIFKPKQF